MVLPTSRTWCYDFMIKYYKHKIINSKSYCWSPKFSLWFWLIQLQFFYNKNFLYRLTIWVSFSFFLFPLFLLFSPFPTFFPFPIIFPPFPHLSPFSPLFLCPTLLCPTLSCFIQHPYKQYVLGKMCFTSFQPLLCNPIFQWIVFIFPFISRWGLCAYICSLPWSFLLFGVLFCAYLFWSASATVWAPSKDKQSKLNSSCHKSFILSPWHQVEMVYRCVSERTGSDIILGLKMFPP